MYPFLTYSLVYFCRDVWVEGTYDCTMLICKLEIHMYSMQGKDPKSVGESKPVYTARSFRQHGKHCMFTALAKGINISIVLFMCTYT